MAAAAGPVWGAVQSFFSSAAGQAVAGAAAGAATSSALNRTPKLEKLKTPPVTDARDPAAKAARERDILRRRANDGRAASLFSTDKLG